MVFWAKFFMDPGELEKRAARTEHTEHRAASPSGTPSVLQVPGHFSAGRKRGNTFHDEFY
ncbi:hypothetical protein GF1_14130 [Desulfolithobacter dissulfuricans]|uniref:Uncharacterized protein n=1 Tax=Desulfolithobacter dissulfuricans TaxID=2795293 RepID=A0A915U5F7_9BACT|nr:hypothetical protein GF1_14130 [Desulfolithobacter dissulfuricans]